MANSRTRRHAFHGDISSTEAEEVTKKKTHTQLKRIFNQH